ncbi:MAG: hypothetical protein JWP97_3690 [Labilithrix sp.]|nr:hypothetical protein [Labilithrix sp.]
MRLSSLSLAVVISGVSLASLHGLVACGGESVEDRARTLKSSQRPAGTASSDMTSPTSPAAPMDPGGPTTTTTTTTTTTVAPTASASGSAAPAPASTP